MDEAFEEMWADASGGSLERPTMREQYRAEREIREARNAEAHYTEKCAWCDEPAEDALGLGWPLCPECGELYGCKRPKSVPEVTECQLHGTQIIVSECQGERGPVVTLTCGCTEDLGPDFTI